MNRNPLSHVETKSERMSAPPGTFGAHKPSKDSFSPMNSQPYMHKPSNAPNLPERKIKSGSVSATVWSNQQQSPQGPITYKSVSFERTYKDRDGRWQTTNKLRATDIPRAVLVLNKAYEYLALGEDNDTEVSA